LGSLLGTFKDGAEFGPYEIRSLVAINMVELYQAYDPRKRRDIILCVFSARSGGDYLEKKSRDWERQTNIARALDNHPNIAAVYEFGTWNGWLFIARELLEGQSLHDHMQGKPLNVATCVKYGLQVATVLAVAHERGIVHGSLRPSAIWVTLDCQIKVLDFGLLPVDKLRHTLAILSNPAYLAPERLRAEDWDYRVDFFAFGALLYEMLAGVSPFQSDSSFKMLRSVLEDDPRPLNELNPRIPRVLDRLVKKCLAKDRGKRPVSARDIVFELERSL
jgi:eukaryotic-like serine/threonine-protein kinase